MPTKQDYEATLKEVEEKIAKGGTPDEPLEALLQVRAGLQRRIQRPE